MTKLKLYRGNVKDGKFPYDTHMPVSLDGKQLLDRVKPNQCYMVLKETIPEGKKLNGLTSLGELNLATDVRWEDEQKVLQLRVDMLDVYNHIDPYLQIRFNAIMDKVLELLKSGDLILIRAILSSKEVEANIKPITDELLVILNYFMKEW